MFKIAPDQVEALEDQAYRQFLEHAVAHLTLHFPPDALRLGPAGLRTAAHAAVKRGEVYGFKHIAELTLFVDQSVMLGGAFEENPAHPWATNILGRSAEFEESAECMDALWDWAMKFLDAAFGDADAVVPFRAYRSILSLLNAATDRDIENPEGMMADFMQIWPEKVEAVGESALAQLASDAFARASEAGLEQAHHKRDFTRLAFLLGHRFDEDPMHPWARNALADAYFDPDKAVRDLRDGVRLNVLEPWLAHQVKG